MRSVQEKLNTIMIKVVSEVLENMAFMEILLSNEPLKPQDIPDLTWSSLPVNDPVAGEFKLLMTRSLNLKISEAVYGLPEEELTDGLLNDTLGEILNTIVGSFFNKVLPDEQTFSLGLPEAGAEKKCPQIDPPTIEWNFNLEEEPVLLTSSGETLIKWLHSFEEKNQAEK